MVRPLHLLARAVALLSVGALFTAAPADAQVITMIGRMNGAQEVPPSPSPAIGLGVYSIDTVANTLTYRINRTQLLGAETLAHIHGFASPGVNAGVLHPLPAGLPKCGVWNYTAADEINILTALTYANVHSTMFPGGEIRGQISELPTHANVCFGDGSGTLCPCANSSAPADQEGCLNNLGRGARLRGYGAVSVANDQLVLHVSRATNSSVLLFRGTVQIPGGTVFGDGLRCVGGNQTRHSVKNACNGQAMWPEPGTPDMKLGVSIPAVGGTFYYQAWYRDAIAAFCIPGLFNLSNAVTINWVP